METISMSLSLLKSSSTWPHPVPDGPCSVPSPPLSFTFTWTLILSSVDKLAEVSWRYNYLPLTLFLQVITPSPFPSLIKLLERMLLTCDPTALTSSPSPDNWCLLLPHRQRCSTKVTHMHTHGSLSTEPFAKSDSPSRFSALPLLPLIRPSHLSTCSSSCIFS